jgi:hypothetical protein
VPAKRARGGGGHHRLHAGDLGANKADITIESKSINSRNARRDTHLKTDDFIKVDGITPPIKDPQGNRRVDANGAAGTAALKR